jgi:hypothetical protein
MIEETPTTVDQPNRWRLQTPGHQGWPRTSHPADPNKFVMISADCHCNEPAGLGTGICRQSTRSGYRELKSMRKA